MVCGLGARKPGASSTTSQAVFSLSFSCILGVIVDKKALSLISSFKRSGISLHSNHLTIMAFLRSTHPVLCCIFLLAFVLAPLFDSMGCDNFARSSPSPGSGVEIKCVHLPGGSASGESHNQGEEDNAHVSCPICYTLTEITYSLTFGTPLFTRTFSPQPLHVSFFLVPLPIYKPPQN